MKRIIGEEITSEFNYKEISLLLLTVESFRDKHKALKPSIWFSYNEVLYYCVFDYEFNLFETYDDWDDFNSHNPEQKELHQLFQLDKTFIKVNPELILNSDLGEFCEFEIEFLHKYKTPNK